MNRRAPPGAGDGVRAGAAGDGVLRTKVWAGDGEGEGALQAADALGLGLSRQVVDERLLHGELAPRQRHGGFPFGVDFRQSVPQLVGHMGGLKRRAHRGHRNRVGNVLRRGQHRRTAQGVADQQRRHTVLRA